MDNSQKKSHHPRVSYRDREIIFRDFERFLKTEEIEIIGMQRQVMRELYVKDYTVYKTQISPETILPTFNDLTSMMFNRQIGYFFQKIYRPGPPEEKKPRPAAQSAAQPQSPLKQEMDRNAESPGQKRQSPVMQKTEKKTDSQGQQGQGNKGQKQQKKNKVTNGHAGPLNGQPSWHRTPPQPSRAKRKQDLRMEIRKIAVDQHLTTRHNQSVMDKEDEFLKMVERDGKYLKCTNCNSSSSSKNNMMDHLSGKAHRINVAINLLKTKRPEMIQGVHGIDITSDMSGEDGTYTLETKPGQTVQSELIVTNRGSKMVELQNCEQMKTMRVFRFNDKKKVHDGTGVVMLKPGDTYKVFVTTKADNVGTYHSPVVFKFKVHLPDSEAGEICHMVRYLKARCTDSIIDELRPTAPYKKPPFVSKAKGRCTEIVPGLPLKTTSSDSLEKKIQLGQYFVPQDLRKMINRGLTKETNLSEGEIVELKNLRSTLELPLTMDTYKRRFEALLYLEEVQMEVDIRKYDMEGVSMKIFPQNRRLLALEVPGLAENRPSILRGDWLFVRICEADDKLSDKEYQGYVHDIQLNEVALGFSQRDTWIENMKFNVRFVFNRLPLRLQHRACNLADELSLGPLLFPQDLMVKKEEPLPRLKLYNAELEKNEKQMCAVQHIVAGTSKPAPYIIFGPPGTGKTVTVVEAIKQVWKLSKDSHILACTPSNSAADPITTQLLQHITKNVWKLSKDSHILACTPSNSAADLITTRLLQHIPKNEILRLNAMSRSWGSVPAAIRDLCNFDKVTKDYYFPTKNEMMNYRIIITTLVTAGRIASASFPPGHFTHVFIDEGGHAVEPEALISLGGIIECSSLMNGTAQVVIAGDPRQLGPVLRSPLAIDYGLDISLLERLMITCDLYQPRSMDDQKVYDVRAITKLLMNYRSHPVILELPNKMFYDSELQPCANQIAREKLCHWEGLPRKGFPVVFHSVIGMDAREQRSPSFFNAEEVSVVVRYVEELLTCKKMGMNVKQEDIGIVTPYRKQVEKIKQVLRKKKCDKISVGSVEEFQGQERTVIIVSTVRSKPEYLSLDLTYNLGFLRNPKRFNVTLTRAKALLIVIGNPNTLSRDPHWNSLIEFCEDSKSYVGTERKREADAIEDIIQRLNAVGLGDEEDRHIPEVRSDYNEQAWRGDI